jgi:hypothetical protein
MTTQTALLIWMSGTLAGSMLFFGIVVAPKVFQALPSQQAGVFLRALFPRYYAWGLIVALLSLVAAFFVDLAASLGCAAVAALFVYARQVLMPRINGARDAALAGDHQAKQRFDRLHRLSVIINGLQLLLLLAIAGWSLWGL